MSSAIELYKLCSMSFSFDGHDSELRRLRRSEESMCNQRNLLQRMLDAWNADSTVQGIEDALVWLKEVLASPRVYVAIYDDEIQVEHPSWWLAPDVSQEDISQLRGTSLGILTECLSKHATVITASALHDPRFKTLKSVVAERIAAVCCTPVAKDPSMGCVYVERPVPFSEEERDLVELFAHELARILGKLVFPYQMPANGQNELPAPKGFDTTGFVGRSRSLGKVLNKADLAAKSRGNYSVLITGESGTGKTRIARLIHDNSERSLAPFQAVNCPAIPESLAESELFGHRQGAFTGADRDRPGLIKEADGGTLFLDEVGDLSVTIQAKLLTFLLEGVYRPVGADSVEQSDVRVIAATSLDLDQRMHEGLFRHELYLRLTGDVLHMPALSSRQADIEPLTRHFIEQYSEHSGYPLLPLSPDTIERIAKLPLGGNLHELRNLVERAVDRAYREHSRAIEPRHLRTPDEPAEDHANDPESPETFDRSLTRFAHFKMQQVLSECEGNHSEAARRLGLHRSRYYRLRAKYNLHTGDSGHQKHNRGSKRAAPTPNSAGNS